ncbi:hypothetical protein LPJ81_004077 [Coemansia sp. IMI 209127]|nr:hypothetical protein LPJ81_004077 [Coemansia sp. IMI 209127]
MQHILKLQAETLVRDLGAPEALVGAVRNLWLLYIGQLDDQDSLDTTHYQDQQNSDTHGVSESATQTQPQTALAANSLYTQHLTQSLGTQPVDDSIDELLKQIDADIADDEEEIIAWQRRNEEHVSSFLEEAQSPGSERPIGSVATADPASEHTSRISFRGGNTTMKEIKKFVRMDYLPAILYLAFLWIKSPIMYGDLYYIIAEERIPYASAYLRLPDQVYSRLGQGMTSVFMVPFAPSIDKIKSLAATFQKLFLATMSITFPQQTLPQQLIMVVKRLALPLDIYRMAMRAMELVGERTSMRINRIGASATSMAAIVVCLKLHYGLDEIERKSTSVDSKSKLDLPPLREFLGAWRDGWESELSIGAIPNLTAYGDRWSHQFAEYYKRRVSRDKINIYRAVYRDISRRYRHAIDELAASDQMDDPQTAQAMIPYEYIHRRRLQKPSPRLGRPPRMRQEVPKESNCQQRTPVIDPAPAIEEIKKYIEPVSISAVYAKGTKEALQSSKRPFATIVEPLTSHPQIQLEPGEKHMLLYTKRHLNVYGDGYTMPTFGLIIARCAMVLGCNPDDLIRWVTLFEYDLVYATTGKLPLHSRNT